MSSDQPGEAAFQELKSTIGGEVLLATDAGYDRARTVWNGMIEKHPLVIVRCAGVADVIAAVNFARQHALLVAVRGGGHNIAGNAVCDGGLVIDLSLMRGMRVDPVTHTVHAQGGVTWGQLDRETQAFGLAVPGGLISTTGIAGLTLGGGIGWLARQCGLSCDNLRSADVVTADGQFLVASAEHHPDLFWAIRGGGGNFGIVTSFEFQAQPLGPMITGGLVLHPFERASEVLRFYRAFIAQAPEALSAFPAFLMVPPLPAFPTALHGTLAIAIVACYAGPPEAAATITQPLHTFGPPAADLLGPMPYVALQSMFDDTAPYGARSYWKSQNLPELSDGSIDVVVAHAARLPELFPLSTIHIYPMDGAIQRRSGDATAFAQRDGGFTTNVIATWFDPAATEHHIQWARGLWQALQPYATAGVYGNFLGNDGDTQSQAVFGANYARLAAIKQQYDPTNFFRLNHNILPAQP